MATKIYTAVRALFFSFLVIFVNANQLAAQAPVITVPSPLVLDCGDINETSDPSAQILDWLGSARGTSSCNPVVLTHDFNSTQLNICAPSTYNITVTWTATDGCANTATNSSTITVVPDNEKPSITVPAPLVLDCGDINETADPSAQILDWLASASATDNCDTDPELTYDFNMSVLNICAPETYVLTVTWTATDHCNNVTTKTQTITVIPDTQKPSITVPAPLVLDCGDISETADPSAQILDWLASASATDNCDTDPELTYDFNMSVLNICAPETYVLTVTWTATDHCNNVTTKTQTITVIPDTQKPSITVPAPLVLDCGDISETADPSAQILDWLGSASATDNCDTDPELTYDFNMSVLNICAPETYVLTVTWTATDHCNNVTTKTQTITVIPDTQKPSITVPAPLVLDCGDISETADPSAQILDWLASASATDNCDTDPELTYDFNMSVLNICAPETYVLTVTWTATDHCNNVTTKTQTITVIPDTQKPSITVPAPLVLDCGDISETADPSAQILDWLGSASATDNCDTDPELTYDFNMSVLNICAPETYVLTVTWTATDHCNNVTTKTQTITVIPDTQDPVITPPANLVLDCNQNEASMILTILDWVDSYSASDNCDTDPEVTRSFSSTNIDFCTGEDIIVTWTARDHCNNISTASATIVINQAQAPVLTCSPDKTYLCYQPVVFDAPTVSGGCGNITIMVLSTTVTPGPNGSEIHCRTWQAVDNCGNTSTSCTQCITIPRQLTIDAGPNKTVYIGYPDSACTKLQSAIRGGVGPHSISWSTGSTAGFINVCPTVTTAYFVTVTDANGCTARDSVRVCVIDVRCGKNKVLICHGDGSSQNPFVTLCESIQSAKSHLKKHAADRLGPCGIDRSCNWPDTDPPLITSVQNNVSENRPAETIIQPVIEGFPNPFNNNTTIRFATTDDDYVSLRLMDITGREIKKLYGGSTVAGVLNQVKLDGSNLKNGIYLVIMNSRKGINKSVKLILSN